MDFLYFSLNPRLKFNYCTNYLKPFLLVNTKPSDIFIKLYICKYKSINTSNNDTIIMKITIIKMMIKITILIMIIIIKYSNKRIRNRVRTELDIFGIKIKSCSITDLIRDHL